MALLRFLQYNNAVPIALSLVLLGGASAFAATSPESIYSEQQTVVSIDNTYLVAKDLVSYSPRTQIVSVTEDSENYYVEYQLYTIDVEDYVWRDVDKNVVMKVSKAELGPYRDLGVYVTKQLGEIISREKQRLADTQEIERRSISQKVVATSYGGLIGKMLDETTEVLPGYTPVIVPPPAPVQVQAHVAAASSPETRATETTQNEQVPSGETVPSAPESDAGAPTLQILGNNPARVAIGSAYADLGAVVTGPNPTDTALGIHVFVNDTEMQTPSIDTSKEGEWQIRYEATNQGGVTGRAERTVIVYDPYAAEKAAAQAAAEAAAGTASSSEPGSSDSINATSSTSTTAE